MLITGTSGAILPETTFTYESLPINGSATVLNTIAAAAPFTFTLTSTGSPSRSTPTSSALTAAEGASQVRLFRNWSIAKVLWASPQNTGQIEPSLTPCETPVTISSGVNSSSIKNFSISSSLVSATASLIASLSPSSLLPMSGRAVGFTAPFAPYSYAL